MTSNAVARAGWHTAVCLGGLLLLNACAARVAHPSTDADAALSSATGIPAAMFDTIAAHWAALEIQRATVRVGYLESAARTLDLNARIAGLQEQLIAVSSTSIAPRQAIRHVLDALDDRQVSLAVQHRRMMDLYTLTSPMLIAIATEERIVDARRAELRVSLGIASHERAAP